MKNKNLDPGFESIKLKVRQTEAFIRRRRILEDKIEDREGLKELIARGQEIFDEAGRPIELSNLEIEIEQLKSELLALETEIEKE